MTKSGEIAMLRRLERCATSPSSRATPAAIVAFCVMIGGGVFLSVADHLLLPGHLEALKWSYFGCGIATVLAAYFLASSVREKHVSKYVDLGAVRKRLTDLNAGGGPDV